MKRLFSTILVLGINGTKAFDIDESVRYTNGGTGIAASFSADGLNYLKMQYLPWVYSKVANINLGDKSISEGLLNLQLSNTNFTLTEPEQLFINDWDTSLNSKSNSLDISTKEQNLVVEADFVGSFGILKLKTGHIKAQISKLGLSFGIGFDTQEATFEKGTGKIKGEELAPAIKIIDLKIEADSANSEIDITGSWEYWITSKVINLF